MEYDFRNIESKWQARWAEKGTFRAETAPGREKYYVLDMFPYPSGAGLHVGHPLGYIASDIVARYKRHRGFNVLHPMGYDSFGLPAEQYAIQTGQHPRKTTEENIARYRHQLDRMGFSFDWSREVRTSDPAYYRWTQWIFIRLFHAWYNPDTDRAEPIDTLIGRLDSPGGYGPCSGDAPRFSALDGKGRSDVLMQYRLAYLSDAWVNWCPALGTVLANEEVKDGVSERGGHPVERKRMPQWSLRITAYAQRLLAGLDTIDWSPSMKEAQRNWIGRSDGSSLTFAIDGHADRAIEVFTTRPDTVFGATFMVLAPEHEWVAGLATAEYREKVDAYVRYARNRNERERQADVKHVTGQFTGACAIHPFTGKKIPVWIAEYVLAGYGTGAVMGVPAHDTRDHAFAVHFGLDIVRVIEPADPRLAGEPCFDTYEGTCVNSSFLDGLPVKEAIERAIAEIERQGLGRRRVNYRLRDAIFGRQRYWGEPIPVYYRNGIPCTVDENDLPLQLPDVDKYLPTESGDPPLARAKDWVYRPGTSGPLSRPLPGGERSEGSKATHKTADSALWPRLKENAREMRKHQTKAEEALWQALRTKKIGFEFRRQHPIDQYIADFVCLEKKLIVEVDGGYHGRSDSQVGRDEGRDFSLSVKGFRTIRFTNEEVLKDMEDVVSRIKEALKALPPGEGLGGAQRTDEENREAAYPLETTTMPGWAGSSWYYLRYMDPHNESAFASKEALDYWRDVDLYIGGSEHATGHLLYVRFWTKFLHDLGYLSIDEPAKKLVNQGMIQGRSNFIYRVEFINQEMNFDFPVLISFDVFESIGQGQLDFNKLDTRIRRELALKNASLIPSAAASPPQFTFTKIHVDVNHVKDDILDLEKLRKWKPEFKEAVVIDNGKCICGWEIEKMSKRWHNVVNPDDICDAYGADCLRMYEMFLGPLEQSKPWNTNGITGVAGFLKKTWKLFDDALARQKTAGDDALRAVHRLIKKVTADIESHSFNTSVSAFMICVNELVQQGCADRDVLETLCILLSPFAPHMAEELWERLGHADSIATAPWPQAEEKYLAEESYAYPVSVNGKTRFKIPLSLALTKEQVEKAVLETDELHKYTDGRPPRKVIVVPGRIVNVVV